MRSSLARQRVTDPARSPSAREAERSAPWQASLFRSRAVTEVHVRARAAPGKGGAAGATTAYEALREALASRGALPSDVVAEKVLLSDVRSFAADAARARERFYSGRAGDHARVPASSIIQQPPLEPSSPCEVKALALIPGDGRSLRRRLLGDLPAGILGCVVERGAQRLVHLSGITGGAPGDLAGAEAQAAAMFIRAQALLLREGLTFHDVFRTWIYLPEIDRDYAAMNRARRAFFRSLGITPPPASTGIQGVPPPEGGLCSMDLRAVSGLAPGAVRTLHAPSLNEAPSYGADFSRGMRVDLGDRTLVHVSGTASIDERGAIVHPGSIEGQAERMLDNVEALLARQGAGFGDVATITTYLKRPEFGPPFLEAARRRGIDPGIPHTVCLAGVCRPGWLCEMEGLAILS